MLVLKNTKYFYKHIYYKYTILKTEIWNSSDPVIHSFKHTLRTKSQNFDVAQTQKMIAHYISDNIHVSSSNSNQS